MKFAFFFPGQGSQSVGMMQGFGDLAVIKDTFVEASDVLGVDFWRMATEPNDALNQTANTQPLMLAAGVATWRAWQSQGGPLPTVLAGHSLGEYTALVAAGIVSYEAALPLVRFRADVMQRAVAEGVGAMAAVLGLGDDAVRAACIEAAQGEVLEAVNLNSPGQVVIAGHKAAVERGIEAAKAKGAKRALLLPVSVPSHCALMKPAADELAEYLKDVDFASAQIPVLHNADVAAYDDATKVKDALVRQLYSPVRWVETVQAVHATGVTASAECGPGKVLAGLVKRTVAELPCIALVNQEALAEAMAQFNQ
ncbi:ACP S-malonyltransferase [Methylobacillus flagellatus]|uniref:Malonyl CoA-acyl carrier protein transacylase n=1 Tax=Methylobacillus flagellatus (strain ATCC 51484 / DSM 6875 / VKM B-1610 / KT) TaxID=265072 RepID=Q1H163_METFK|nr:ACP S-malonyltransferase [Methylobacillus flagellatus]ABE49774.1 [Acyl-carrier-protein] S-malonyltransferase [Methylobacillus flagellatus KT]